MGGAIPFAAILRVGKGAKNRNRRTKNFEISLFSFAPYLTSEQLTFSIFSCTDGSADEGLGSIIKVFSNLNKYVRFICRLLSKRHEGRNICQCL